MKWFLTNIFAPILVFGIIAGAAIFALWKWDISLSGG